MSTSSGPPVCTTTFPLNNGKTIPAVGLGTWQGQFGTNEDEALKASIIHALKGGYRLIDTAQYYGIESVVGEAIRDSGIPRSEITVVTKIWGHWFHDPVAAFERSFRELKLDYIDILLMHWPCTMNPDETPQPYPGTPPYWEVWKNLEPLVGDRLKSIGVSNFTQKTLDRLLEVAKIVPVVNEIELHALNPSLKLVPYCFEKGIRVISWSTMGSERFETGQNPILTDKLFVDLAKKYDCSAGVISLSWAVQRGISVIPKSSKPHRIDSNIRLVTLSEDDMKTLNNAHDTLGRLCLCDRIKGIQYEVDGKTTVLGWSHADFGWTDDDGNWLT
ncbi:D-galacturonate reductase-like protein 2 [Elsinoe fawcettii]|nr:D-galacturonate reductase-like protein 2 [Elsinoe fawcettii]